MKLILFRNSTEKPLRLTFSPRQVAVWAGCGLVVLAIVGGAVGYQLGGRLSPEQRTAMTELTTLRDAVTQQQAELERLRVERNDHLNALALQLGQLQARATRIEALGERLTELSELGDGEFDFRSQPALGGPAEPVSDPAMNSDRLEVALASLGQRLDERHQQLDVLGQMLSTSQIEQTLRPAGRPVKSGWQSSGCCERIDPFTGKTASHMGIDFSGKAGSEIVAVASGVVTWSGSRFDYGNTVDIDHGNGYVTRYAHNQENLVAVGDKVEAGQTIALMGSTGRSTAPHVHFEVHKNGRRINPTRFVRTAK